MQRVDTGGLLSHLMILWPEAAPDDIYVLWKTAKHNTWAIDTKKGTDYPEVEEYSLDILSCTQMTMAQALIYFEWSVTSELRGVI
jgi:hypothetical protein